MGDNVSCKRFKVDLMLLPYTNRQPTTPLHLTLNGLERSSSVKVWKVCNLQTVVPTAVVKQTYKPMDLLLCLSDRSFSSFILEVTTFGVYHVTVNVQTL